VPNFVAVDQTVADFVAINRFSKMAFVCHFRFVVACLDHTRYRCAKFGWNRCSSFNISRVWFKNVYLRPISVVLGDFVP